jgi:hypothetical protein
VLLGACRSARAPWRSLSARASRRVLLGACSLARAPWRVPLGACSLGACSRRVLFGARPGARSRRVPLGEWILNAGSLNAGRSLQRLSRPGRTPGVQCSGCSGCHDPAERRAFRLAVSGPGTGKPLAGRAGWRLRNRGHAQNRWSERHAFTQGATERHAFHRQGTHIQGSESLKRVGGTGRSAGERLDAGEIEFDATTLFATPVGRPTMTSVLDI